jgi:hypothetical protein
MADPNPRKCRHQVPVTNHQARAKNKNAVSEEAEANVAEANAAEANAAEANVGAATEVSDEADMDIEAPAGVRTERGRDITAGAEDMVDVLGPDTDGTRIAAIAE